MVAKRIHCLESLPVWAALAWGVVLAGPANGVTIRVPQDCKTIQEAINSAGYRDEIVVSPGVYIENIRFNGKDVVLRSVNPTDSATVAATIIDGNKKDCVVRFAGTETSACVLSGFTIRNGLAKYGGGIYGNGTTGYFGDSHRNTPPCAFTGRDGVGAALGASPNSSTVRLPNARKLADSRASAGQK